VVSLCFHLPRVCYPYFVGALRSLVGPIVWAGKSKILNVMRHIGMGP
jgi:hypothetical protein